MKKTSIYLIIEIVIIICLFVGVFILYYKKPTVVIDKNIIINLNDLKKNSDYVKVTNGKILNEYTIDTSTIGTKDVKVIVRDIFGFKEEYKYQVDIEDLTPPELIIHNKNLYTEIYKEINLLDNVEVKDNSSKNIEVKIEGSYNFKETKTFILNYVCSDESGNTTKKEFTLTVTNEKPTEDKTFTTSNGHNAVVKNGITYIDGYLIANKTYNLPSNYNPGKLLTEFSENFNKMKEDAKIENINLKIVSGYRSYETQKKLHYNYVKDQGSQKAETHSARAGYSEHQSGLAADINLISQKFATQKEGIWLNDNCYKYGFIIRYPKDKNDETGYIYEPWHIRYVGKELAEKLYNNGNWITMEKYFGITSSYQN